MKKQFAIVGFFTVVVLTGCSSTETIEKTIEKNPDIVFNAIEKNPERFLKVVQEAAKSAQELAAKKRAEQEEAELAQAFENPLTPAINNNEAVLGPDNAPITLVEYSDFECPYCSRGYETVQSLLKKYPGKIRFVYKHLPLNFHPSADIAARYFEAIRLQSPQKAFEFHDKIFTSQSSLKQGEKFLKKVALDVGANMKKLAIDIQSKEVQEKLENHENEARMFNMQGTPGFIINGIPVRGAYPAEYFVSIIEKLQEKGKLTI